MFFFFFKQKTAYEVRISDWSSDVCSSDLTVRIESSSTRILPSVNAIFEVAPDTLVRVAGYRAMSRPNPSALGAGRTFTLGDGDDGGFTSIEEAIDNVRAQGSTGLKPLMSWNADAANDWSQIGRASGRENEWQYE